MNSMEGIAEDLRGIAAGMPMLSKHRQSQGMRSHIIPMNNARATYEYFRSIYPKEVVVTEGFLRSVVPMPSNQAIQTISFYFTKNNQTQNLISIENKLDLSDVFQCTDFKFGYFTLPGGNAVAGGLPVPSQPYSLADFQWFNNSQVFTDGPGGGGYTEAVALGAPYTAWLYVKIQETVYFEQFPMAHFKEVGVSQQGTAVSSVPTTGVISETSQDGKKVKVMVTPVIEIDGTGKQDFQIQLQDAVVLSPTVNYATRGNYMVMELHGYKAQGAVKRGTLKHKV